MNCKCGCSVFCTLSKDNPPFFYYIHFCTKCETKYIVLLRAFYFEDRRESPSISLAAEIIMEM